jgi:hypothetical protein
MFSCRRQLFEFARRPILHNQSLRPAALGFTRRLSIYGLSFEAMIFTEQVLLNPVSALASMATLMVLRMACSV